LNVEQCKRAEEVFITLTSAEVTPVIHMDQSEIGNGKPGAVTRRLQEAFREYVQRQRAVQHSAIKP
jgi:D-alanine transaminase